MKRSFGLEYGHLLPGDPKYVGIATPQRLVTQYHYDDWPNYGVPSTTLPVRQVLREVESSMPALSELGEEVSSGVLVHCSGGVGRTGVFLVALTSLRSWRPLDPSHDPTRSTDFDIDGELNVRDRVASLRRQRHPWAVEGLEQYWFLHQLLRDELLGRVRATPDARRL
jgi:protein tyrosine phosphatase